MNRLLLLTLMAALCLVAEDVTGTWNFEVQLDAGSGAPVLVLKQDGDALSGTYSGALGERKVTGSVKGPDVVIEFEGEYSGEKFTVRYTGKLEGSRKMSGKVSLGNLASGTFTGTKK
jgi:hypothetical protein